MRTGRLILCGVLAALCTLAGCVSTGRPVGAVGATLIAAEEAERSPVLKLSNFAGDERKVQLGKEGYVTLVVFFDMFFVRQPGYDPVKHGLSVFLKDNALNGRSPAAAMHVRDLAQKYSGTGARAVGIVERTVTHKLAPEFKRVFDIPYAFYYDDLSALQEMGKVVGADVRMGEPFFLIIDRDLRVRMFKRGFDFWSATTWSEERQGTVTEVHESPEEGTVSIEDALKELLAEQ